MTVTLSVQLPPGVAAGALTPVTIGPGQSATVLLTLTPEATVPLNAGVPITTPACAHVVVHSSPGR